MNTTLSALLRRGSKSNSAAAWPPACPPATCELPHEIGERLRAARVQAVARRKVVPQLRTRAGGRVERRHGGARRGGWWTRIGSVVPLVALVAGPVAISVLQDDNRANELAEVDAALLTDDLPPAAYTDPGLRSS